MATLCRFHKALGLGWGWATSLALRLFLIAGLLTTIVGGIVLRA